MANVIKLGHSNTSGHEPNALAAGEVAINTASGKIWVGNGSGNSLLFNTNAYAPASANASESYVTTQINNLIDAAPGALNTLNELAAAIGDNASYATTITNALAGKSSTSHNHDTTYLGLTHKAADSGLLDGVDSLKYLKGYGNVSGWQNSNANFSIRSGSTSVGLHMEGSSGEFGFQLYSSGTAYGFLDGEWAGWDIQKYENGAFSVDEGSGLNRVWNAGNVVGGTGISVSGQTITNTVTNTWRSISDSVSTTSSSVSASQTAVKAAYDRSWPNTQLSSIQVRAMFSGGTNVAINSSGVISATNTTYSEGDHGLTQANFTDTLRTKLDGITAGAQPNVGVQFSGAYGGLQVGGGYVSHYIGTPYNHIPANGSSGQFLGYSASGTAQWVANPNTWRSISDSVTESSSTISASKTAVKAAYDRSWPNTQLTDTQVRSKFSGGTNVSINSSGVISATDTNTHRAISDSVSTTSSSVSASQTAVKAAYDRSWPDTWRGLGGTSSTGHRGDHGVTAYTHSQAAHAPSNANYVNNTNQLTNGSGYITSSQSTMGSLFGGGWSGVTNQGFSRDAAYKIMNNSNSSVACVTTVNGSTNEYLRYASGGNFSWDTIEYNQLQNVSALTALP